jgi:hypothetical protein
MILRESDQADSNRLPPCPPSEPQNPQLPSEEVLRCRSGTASQGAAHNCEKSSLYSAENVGRGATENDRFSLKWSVLTEKSGSGRAGCHGANLNYSLEWTRNKADPCRSTL